jgi:hypothetical protein
MDGGSTFDLEWPCAVFYCVRACNIDDEAFDQAEDTGRSIKQQPVRS